MSACGGCTEETCELDGPENDCGCLSVCEESLCHVHRLEDERNIRIFIHNARNLSPEAVRILSATPKKLEEMMAEARALK